MKIVKEFKEFAVKGNVVDMAVGIIIGAAFGKITGSLVADIFSPILGVVIGGVDFSGLMITLDPAKGEIAAVAIKYGVFIQTIIDFIIVAFAMFMLIKVINRVKRSEAQKPAAPAEPPADVKLLSEIRDILKEKKA
jgi:large conductance mechanosensitive channel